MLPLLLRGAAAVYRGDEGAQAWTQEVLAADHVLEKVGGNVLQLPFEHSHKIKKEFLIPD